MRYSEWNNGRTKRFLLKKLTEYLCLCLFVLSTALCPDAEIELPHGASTFSIFQYCVRVQYILEWHSFMPSFCSRIQNIQWFPRERARSERSQTSDIQTLRKKQWRHRIRPMDSHSHHYEYDTYFAAGMYGSIIWYIPTSGTHRKVRVESLPHHQV